MPPARTVDLYVDYSWSHTNPKRKRGLHNHLPSLALRVSMQRRTPSPANGEKIVSLRANADETRNVTFYRASRRHRKLKTRRLFRTISFRGEVVSHHRRRGPPLPRRRSVWGRASLTVIDLPLISTKFSPLIAAAASLALGISTNANPRGFPVSRSFTTLTSETFPCCSNARRRSSSVAALTSFRRRFHTLTPFRFVRDHASLTLSARGPLGPRPSS